MRDRSKCKCLVFSVLFSFFKYNMVFPTYVYQKWNLSILLGWQLLGREYIYLYLFSIVWTNFPELVEVVLTVIWNSQLWMLEYWKLRYFVIGTSEGRCRYVCSVYVDESRGKNVLGNTSVCHRLVWKRVIYIYLEGVMTEIRFIY